MKYKTGQTISYKLTDERVKKLEKLEDAIAHYSYRDFDCTPQNIIDDVLDCLDKYMMKTPGKRNILTAEEHTESRQLEELSLTAYTVSRRYINFLVTRRYEVRVNESQLSYMSYYLGLYDGRDIDEEVNEYTLKNIFKDWYLARALDTVPGMHTLDLKEQRFYKTDGVWKGSKRTPLKTLDETWEEIARLKREEERQKAEAEAARLEQLRKDCNIPAQFDTLVNEACTVFIFRGKLYEQFTTKVIKELKEFKIKDPNTVSTGAFGDYFDFETGEFSSLPNDWWE